MLRPLLLATLLASPAFSADILLKPGNLSAVIEQARKAPKPVRIVVEDGLHPITRPIELGAADSQTTWCSQNAVFSAGRPITGWQPAEGGLWKATLPDKAWRFEQLWINCRRLSKSGFNCLSKSGQVSQIFQAA